MTQRFFVRRLVLTVLAATMLSIPVSSFAQPLYWQQSGHSLSSREFSTIVELEDGRVLIASGLGGPSSVEIHDPVTGTTVAAASLPSGRAEASAIRFADGRVGLFGGYRSSTVLSDTLVYDPSTNSWTAFAPMPKVLKLPLLAPLPNGELLITGGNEAATAGVFSRSAYAFKPSSNSWRTLPSMPSAKYGGAIATLNDGRIMVAGGYGGGGAAIFDPSTEVWTSIAQPPTDDTLYSALFPRPGGAIHVTSYGSIQIYDAAANKWIPAAPIDERRFPTSIALPDHRIMVAGGMVSGAEVRSTLIYDPQDGEWTNGPDMLEEHSGMRAVPLAGDRFLVMGARLTGGTMIELLRMNEAPVANAGPDRTVVTCGSCLSGVVVDALGSGDPDGDTLTYTWSKGGTVVATHASAFVALDTGTTTLTLKVRDQYGLQATDDVTITVTSIDDVYRAQIAGLESQVMRLTDDIHALMTEKATLQVQNLELANDNAALQAEVSALGEQLNLLMQDKSALQTRVDALTAAKAIAEAELAQCSAGQSAAATSLDAYETALRTAFRNAAFEIPGHTPMEQLQNLLIALADLRRNQQRAIFRNLGGTPGKKK